MASGYKLDFHHMDLGQHAIDYGNFFCVNGNRKTFTGDHCSAAEVL
jgi:hypothetical protein